eukprot:TRINITY_DN1509_c0_g2_i1.p1 TRINITY_DN1509_c0_g2~~TRINITY_DN1509_c0_g2_i1.p1  ORF type:complete len:241 (-),score=39.59 TRINITY_DN1509_c0_g2_i1:127-798(-)
MSRFKKETLTVNEPAAPNSAPSRLGRSRVKEEVGLKEGRTTRGAKKEVEAEEDEDVVFVSPSPPKRSRSGRDTRGGANGALAGLSLLAEMGAKKEEGGAGEDNGEQPKEGPSSHSKKKRTRMVEESPERKPGKKEVAKPKAEPEQPPKKKAQTDSPAGTTPRSAEAGTSKGGEYCTVCNKVGELVHCAGDQCATQVHPECVRLRGIPKVAWFCQKCRVKGKGK